MSTGRCDTRICTHSAKQAVSAGFDSAETSTKTIRHIVLAILSHDGARRLKEMSVAAGPHSTTATVIDRILASVLVDDENKESLEAFTGFIIDLGADIDVQNLDPVKLQQLQRLGPECTDDLDSIPESERKVLENWATERETEWRTIAETLYHAELDPASSLSTASRGG